MDHGCRQNRVRDGDRMIWKGAPVPHYAQDKIWKRLRLNAKQIRHHSPAAAVPRKENRRKPSTSLMIPITDQWTSSYKSPLHSNSPPLSCYLASQTCTV